jgi:hypothetical protein
VFSNKRTDSGTQGYNVTTFRGFNLNSVSFINYRSLWSFLVHSRQAANALHEAEYLFRSSKLVFNSNVYSKPAEYT